MSVKHSSASYFIPTEGSVGIYSPVHLCACVIYVGQKPDGGIFPPPVSLAGVPAARLDVR